MINRKESPWVEFRRRWHDCRLCPLWEKRTCIVFARGRVPADVLFIGEAPGPSEDVIGQPFVGPAGKLLDGIIDQAIDGQYEYCLTNLVCCLPSGEDGGKFAEPPKESILACSPRLKEMVSLVDPRLIVSVGSIAAKWVPQILIGHKAIFASIVHPAAILRADVSQRSIAVRRCISQIEDSLAALG